MWLKRLLYFRFTKNLSSDKINISTFKGEGELFNLQLDEAVLTELLELPSWLRLTSAWCNHISFRISWAKLKSVPITLSLDEVNISIETCEIARSGTPTGGGNMPSLTAPVGKYSFIHKVIDGITILVNTVNVNFKSPAFSASVQVRNRCKLSLELLLTLHFVLDVKDSCWITDTKVAGSWTPIY